MKYVPRFARKNCPRKACKYRQFRCFFWSKLIGKHFLEDYVLYRIKCWKIRNVSYEMGNIFPKTMNKAVTLLSPIWIMDCTNRPNFNKNIIAIFETFCMSASRNIQHQSCLINTMIEKARQWQNLNPTKKIHFDAKQNKIPPWSKRSQNHFSTTNTIHEVTGKAKQCSDLSTKSNPT